MSNSTQINATIICTTEEEFMTTICNAIMTTALSRKSQQIIYDGQQLQIEEVICREFTRGYVISYDSQAFDMPSPDSRSFTQWLADLLFIHANACSEYLHAHSYIIRYTLDPPIHSHNQSHSRSHYGRSSYRNESGDSQEYFDNRNFNM